MNIPKPDGGTRSLSVATIEDKIVQKAVAETILTPIYEAEFLGFSYGFRPGRGAHNTPDALAVGHTRRKIMWVVDCDIRKFFDTVSRDWLVRFLEHRIIGATPLFVGPGSILVMAGQVKDSTTIWRESSDIPGYDIEAEFYSSSDC